MAALRKPSGLRPPKIVRPLQSICGNEHVEQQKPVTDIKVLRRSRSATDLLLFEEKHSDNQTATKASSKIFLPFKGLRRSKSVCDLRSIVRKPLHAPKTFKPENIKENLNKKIVTQNVKQNPRLGIGTKTNSNKLPSKRPSPAGSVDSGPSKPKIIKTNKIASWDYKARFNQLQEKYNSLQESTKTMKTQLAESEHIREQFSTLQKLYKDAQEQIKLLSHDNEAHIKEVKRVTDLLSELKVAHEKLLKEHEELAGIVTELKDVKSEKDQLTISLNQAKDHIYSIETTLQNMKQDLQNYQTERRRLHNTIQDLKGNIRVFCRVRPPINSEEMDSLQCQINIDQNVLEIRKSRESFSNITGKVQEQRGEFTFDRLFPCDSTQEELFEDLAQLVQSALDGYDICVFAYGQTGSGKTYTMQGGDSAHSRGVIPRSIDLIFESIEVLKRSGWKYTVHASFLEIYNEQIRDLLNANSQQKLDIYFNEGKGMTVQNLFVKQIFSAQELNRCMVTAHKNRVVAVTNFNEHSSRSHAVTKICLEGVSTEQNLVLRGSINLVDLAGSESARDPVNNDRLAETKNINKSLATLGDVIVALKAKNKHVPYRNSKLTYLLQSCLGGNSKTLMVVNIAPFEECFNESISSLRFAAKVKDVKTNSKKNKTALNTLAPSKR
ncbi:protein claret segregational isoform X2 [Cylas formicarius]|uniref:protein claret segregational isoform X2 n=1 Tax=Cylas formicarius TaxID=197179 RepID=UPI00295839C6|nr:protein claret segregational isoform X2 [Cylas formicarius]